MRVKLEIKSLALDELDIDELDRRIELAPASATGWCGCSGDCSAQCGAECRNFCAAKVVAPATGGGSCQ